MAVGELKSAFGTDLSLGRAIRGSLLAISSDAGRLPKIMALIGGFNYVTAPEDRTGQGVFARREGCAIGKRHRFSGDLQVKIAQETLRGDRTLQEIALKILVHPNQVSPWKRPAIEGRSTRRLKS